MLPAAPAPWSLLAALSDVGAEAGKEAEVDEGSMRMQPIPMQPIPLQPIPDAMPPRMQPIQPAQPSPPTSPFQAPPTSPFQAPPTSPFQAPPTSPFQAPPTSPFSGPPAPFQAPPTSPFSGPPAPFAPMGVMPPTSPFAGPPAPFAPIGAPGLAGPEGMSPGPGHDPLHHGSPLAPSDAGPQVSSFPPMMGMPTPPGTPTFSGEVTQQGRVFDDRPDRPLLRRTSPLLFIVPLVLLLAWGAVWFFVIRVAPVDEVAVETPAVEVPVAPELPAAVLTPEPVVPEPVVTPEPVVPVVPPAGKQPIATKTGKTGKTGKTKTGKTGTSKSGTGKPGTGGTGTAPGKVGGASKPPVPETPTKVGQGGKADPGRVIMELEMLSAAKKSLAGNPGQSLAYIEQHDREFPQSQLTDKFDEARIKAMCNLGRGAQARTLAASILKKRPGSLVGAAVKECKS